MKTLTEKFNKEGINVIGIRSCISTSKPYEYFKYLPLGIKSGYLIGEDFIDQICERDFYFGIAQSGISVKTEEGTILKAPYFLPFGDPVNRASIPKEFEKMFSQSCLDRSIALWQEIERLSKRTIYIKDLPEKIQNTEENEEVVKTLLKGRK